MHRLADLGFESSFGHAQRAGGGDHAKASPMFGIYPILAQKHGHDGLAAAALLGTTAASFFTISALLWVFRQVGWSG